MSKANKTLVLLDAHAIIHRAYHALPEFFSSRGEPTGALYGLSTMLMKIISDLKPDYIVACYDRREKTFRHEAYEAYKGRRVKTDDALILQLEKSRQIFEAFNIPTYDCPGFEADDILGTIVAHFYPHPSSPYEGGGAKGGGGIKIIIASGDMDTMQLVDGERVQVYTLKKGLNDTILYNEEKVVERFGFAPKFLPDYKGLRGDPSDNIIGIKGIGEKTAQSLIVNFGTVENIYKKLKKDEKAFKSAGISDRMIELVKAHEEDAIFSKTLATIRADAPVNFSVPKETFWDAADLGKVEDIFNRLEFRSLITRLRSFFHKNGAEIKTGSLGLDFGTGSGEQVDPRLLQEASIALWLLNSDITTPTLEDILSFSGKKSFALAREYIFGELKGTKLEKVFSEIEQPIMGVVKKMEEWGIGIDKKYFTKLSKEYHQELDKITQRIYTLAGEKFNINSPKQLGQILFVKMGIKSGQKKTSGGALSTKFSVLEELGDEYPIVKEILAYRELSKLLSTYVDVIPGLAGEDGRLHGKFLQNGSTTGRFSSQDPNLQNLPIKSELGRRIRRGFVASSGYKLAAFDYSQIELRVAAILSGDKKLTEIFRDKKDVHAGVAMHVFGVPLAEVSSEMRRQAKVINFGILYGMGVSALRKNLGGSREEAQKFYDNYFREFSGLKNYLEEVKEFARKNLYVETLFGRRRNFQNINSKLPFLRSMAERTAINAPIQGTATADIIKLAIRFVDEDLRKAELHTRAHLVLQIHDELVYEVEEGVLSEVSKVIEAAMGEVLSRSFLKYKTPVPLLVRFGAGKNLEEIK